MAKKTKTSILTVEVDSAETATMLGGVLKALARTLDTTPGDVLESALKDFAIMT
jgi:hypothetical protein